MSKRWRPKPASGIPARGYSRKPFVADNDAAVRHGAHSEKLVGPEANKRLRALLDDLPWLKRPEFVRAAAALARIEAKTDLIVAWLEDNGVLDEKGEPRAAAEFWRRLESLALRARETLGLSPSAYAQTAADLAAARQDDGDGIRSEARIELRRRIDQLADRRAQIRRGSAPRGDGERSD